MQVSFSGLLMFLEQTYTRFLDLQKAEAQAREAKIEAALERVRSITMAMQKSEDLNEAASDMFKQIQSLGMQPWGCGFNIFDKDEKAVTQYMSLADGGISPPFRTPLTGDPFFIRIYDARQRRDELLVMESKGESLAATYRYMFSLPGSGEIFGDLENSGFEMPKFQITHCAYFSQGYLVFITYEPVPEAYDIFKRFAKVFEQTYTRFLDLQKAEAQAREAQIEAALERVRSRTMAMHKSSELLETAELLFDQLNQLGAELQGVAFAICDKVSVMVQKWTSIGVFSHPYNIEPGEERMYEAWKNQAGMYEEVYEGERQQKYYEAFMQIPEFRQGLQKFIDSGYPIPTWQKNHAVTFKYGYLLFITTKPFDETQIFLRFGKVFEQTYTRFLDLQKAEAQARESQIQLALERVRARTMAMQKSDELSEAVYILFKQFGELGENPDQATIGVINEQEHVIEYWVTMYGNQSKLKSLSFLLMNRM